MEEFDPSHLIILLFFGAIFFGIICSSIGAKRNIGSAGGFFLGFFLGLIGLIIVLCSARKAVFPPPFFPGVSIPDQLKKYKDLLDSGAITEAEYNLQKSRLLNQ
jgi:tellurite resistance protein TehA-like permease